MINVINLKSADSTIYKKVKLLIGSLFLIFSGSVFGQELKQINIEIYDMINKEIPARGVYAVYNDFRTNSPSITDSFYVKESPRTKPIWQGSFSVQPRYLKKNKKVKKVWGYSDGKQTFIFNELEFFPILVENNELVFYGYDRLDNSGAAAAGALGGAIGGGIAASVALSKAKSEKIRYVIHPVNGTAEHPDGSLYETRPIMNELIVYRRSRKESDLPAKFLVDGNQLYSFEHKSYVLLEYPISFNTVTLCSGNDYSDCVTVSLNSEEPTYVECTYLDDSESAQLILPVQSQGEFDFYKIEKNQDKRGEQVPEIRE